MNLTEFQAQLSDHSASNILFQFEDGSLLAPHFHVTEVGKVSKDFVDCGGVRRSTVSCMLQTLVANDVDHRLTCGKLAGILEKATVLGLKADVPVEAEVQQGSISIYSVEKGSVDNGSLIFRLATKQTACLAPDQCGLELPTVSPVSLGQPAADAGCCGGSSGSSGGG